MQIIRQLVFPLSIAIAILAMVAGFGVRMDWWGYPMGFTLLRYGFFAAAACAVTSMMVITVSLVKHLPLRSPVLGALLVSGVLVITPGLYLAEFRKVPTLGEAATDFENLPSFDVLAGELRASQQDPSLFTLEEAEAAQRESFPDLGPIELAQDPGQAKAMAIEVLTAMGFTLAAGGSDEMRVEATDTTFWFGFKDDVVIEIAPGTGGGVLVNVRSASRVGKFDGGANAKRVQAILAGLRQTAG